VERPDILTAVMSEASAPLGPPAASSVTRVRRWWPDVLIVVGIAWLSYACSAFAGDGAVDGQLSEGGGELSGDFSVSYTPSERINIAAASVVTTIGLLAKLNRRSS
jgi:hypothetical protein